MMEEKLPKGWRHVSLSKIGKVVTGNTPSKSNPEYFDGNIPWVKPGDVKKGRIIFQTEETLSELGAEKARMLPKGSVIVTCIGDLGNVTVAGRDLATNQQINAIIVDENLADHKYVYYWSLTLKKWLIDNSTSTTISMVNKSNFEKAPIILPPLPEQQRIVAKLDTLFGHLDWVREKLDRIPALLKNFRQQVLTQALTGELTKEWREGKGLGEWERVELSKLGKWVGGGTPSKSEPAFWNNGVVLWITPKDMKSVFVSDSLDKITPEAVEKSSTKLVPSNSILIVTRSGILRRILPISLNTKEATVNQDLKVLIPKKEVYPKFLLYSLIGLEENIRINCMKSGTTVESIEFSDLKAYQLGIPTFNEQEEIVRKVEALFSLADKIESQYQSLKAKIDQLPQAILAKAFRGELVEQVVKGYEVVGREGLMAAEKTELYKLK